MPLACFFFVELPQRPAGATVRLSECGVPAGLPLRHELDLRDEATVDRGPSALD